ncbi:SOS response-associated peptidase [Salinisphaera sp. SPP-AMP-43]|uniref:SOS response-associated peptidase n=1 Tax=Salinisphaera sp. SPP-AMP-43 TaxID=3121288 RepID=UPI003C6DFD52
MCGRFGLGLNARSLLSLFDLEDEGTLTARYNIAPGQSIPSIRCTGEGYTPELEAMYWGFIPSWDDIGKRPVINARSEKCEGRFWRQAFARRRCLIPASWWYEWQPQEHGKQPYAIQPSSGEPFCFAGIWAWPKSLPGNHRAAGQAGCAIVTREAVPELASIHSRMPVALTEAGARRWLARDTSVTSLGELIDRGIITGLRSWPVSLRVNDPKTDDASLIAPVSHQEPG